MTSPEITPFIPPAPQVIEWHKTPHSAVNAVTLIELGRHASQEEVQEPKARGQYIYLSDDGTHLVGWANAECRNYTELLGELTSALAFVHMASVRTAACFGQMAKLAAQLILSNPVFHVPSEGAQPEVMH